MMAVTRARDIPSTEEAREKELTHIKRVLTINNYPTKLVQKGLRQDRN